MLKKQKNFVKTTILLAQINWNDTGGFFYIPLKAQKLLFDKIGRRNYIKLPKPGTNPRGVEITKEALSSLVEDSESRRIEISWQMKNYRKKMERKQVHLALQEESITILHPFTRADYMKGCLKKNL